MRSLTPLPVLGGAGGLILGERVGTPEAVLGLEQEILSAGSLGFGF